MQKNNKTALAIFGLGRMGTQIAKRLHKNRFNIYAWNRSIAPVQEIKKFGIKAGNSIEEVVNEYTSALKGKKQARIFWIMLPHQMVEEFIFDESYLGRFLRKGDIVIDGGNSFYKQSMNIAEKLKKKGIYFFDSGTSGGVWGEKNGFALMVGGDKTKWPIVKPIFATLSSGDNYAYLGKAGAGHFTKMIHNGIEYGMMEAIAEGYAVLDASPFKLNLKDVTRVYQKGSVVRSWLIDLCRNIFENENIPKTIGKIDATGEGEWTVNTAKELGIDARVIEDALKVRKESQDINNQKKFSNKIVALLRKQFGGHAIHTKDNHK